MTDKQNAGASRSGTSRALGCQRGSRLAQTLVSLSYTTTNMKSAVALLCGLLALLLLIPARSQAQAPTVVLISEPTNLAGHLEMVWTSKDTSFDVAASLPFSSTFTPHSADGSVLWARGLVQNQGVQTSEWILRSERFLNYSSVELYRPQQPTQRFDKEMPVSERLVYDTQPAFQIALSPGESAALYLRIEPNPGWDFLSDPSPELRFIPEEQWLTARFYRFIGQTAFFTFLAVTILYQLLTVLIEVDRSRLWYISLLCSYIVYFAFLSNFSAEFFAPYLSEWLFAALGLPWMMLSYAGFISSFLDLRINYPRVRAALFTLAGFTCLISVIDLISKVSLGYTNNAIIVPASNLSSGALIMLALSVTILRIREGYRPARLFLLASGTLALSGLAVVLMFLGVSAAAAWGPAVFQMGVVAECLILSVAVTNRLRFIRRDKEQSLAMLEQRVQEVQTLKTELDHQLAARSRELTQVMALSWSLPIEQKLALGDTFEGRYRVLSPLGKGGMGVVFMVERLSDNKRLALKLLRGASSRADAARFTREAEISAKMTHPNLVKLFDVGLTSGSPYIVMELVEGGSLEEQRAHFGEVAWALPLLAGIAKGLAVLHQAGIVHRDLKPSNILLDNETPKIADFGISRMEGEPTLPPPQDPTSGTATTMGAIQLSQATPELTAVGAILGTPRYMPPEAAEGAKAAGPAWDIFSFGIMAYEMLIGKVPFEGVPVRLALQGKPLPPIQVSLENIDLIPKPVAIIITACLAASPSDRPTASVLEDCLSN